MLVIIIKSIIIGALAGAAVSAGAARMFFAPEVQSMGSFRTIGELNACKGDPITHFSFGLGFLFNSAASVVGAGALTQDVLHRVVPNWAEALLLLKNPKAEETMYNPTAMAISGSIVGAVVVTFLNTIASAIPESMSMVAQKILGPASNLMINPVMPIIFWIAALDAGKTTGIFGTIFGGLAHMIMGNAVPGVVLGILIGKSFEENKNQSSNWALLLIVIALFAVIAYFRGFYANLLKFF
ncbi:MULTISPECIES: DUF4311 domain-containing protein [Tepidanaerobacter]|uniref:DUF4311 domain-containing protein n=1 Tax=Tepidanaerobacter TaxID=499228 RepID=UPI000B23382C|nr:MULTISPECIES: DUF4311 domain-containing protein [Tepidanaerobacter]GLI18765.1 membrane protein [Tepidanaerobacter syntrophicus]GLI50842.1 membrane protein [Tepidanaerobacter syntrophicus]HHV83846.1 DUF4311 domain-containing protein [Tepidanaerobacter syntrophicus]